MISTKKLIYAICNRIDAFYPVGSYYETSDTSFDPNVTWGGTWELEVQGQVHVSSGANYAVSGALSNTTDGGSANAVVVSHTHASPSVTTPKLTANNSNYITSATAVSSYRSTQSSSDTGDYNYMRVATNGASTGKSAPTINAGVSCTVGSIGTTGSSATGANMMPYIVVNRWHRTA